MDKNTLAFGLQLGLVNLSEDLMSLNLAADNQFQVSTGNVTAPNVGAGIYYTTPKWYAGLSVPRLLQNRLDVATGEAKVENRLNGKDLHYFVTTGAVFGISPSLKLRPNLMLKAVSGAPMQVDISCNLLVNDFIWGGLAYRTGDAVSALLGVQITKQLHDLIRYKVLVENNVEVLAEFVLGYKPKPFHREFMRWQNGCKEGMLLAWRGSAKTTYCTIT